MPRKKSAEEMNETLQNTVEQNEETLIPETVENEESVENKEVENNTEENVENEVKEEKSTSVEHDIPGYVDEILKSMTDYEELYIDNKGGAFTIDTKPELRKGAILYKNPYFE